MCVTKILCTDCFQSPNYINIIYLRCEKNKIIIVHRSVVVFNTIINLRSCTKIFRTILFILKSEN